MRKELNDFFIGCRCNAVDKKLAQDISTVLGVNESDFIRMAIWAYATSSESKLIKDSLKELAIQQKKSFEIQVFKELEFINNKQAFFIDGVKTALENYKNKHVPLNYVKRFIVIKIIGLYSIYPNSRSRKEYLDYLKKHFTYHFSSQSAWLDKQLKLIKSMKKNEKDKLLLSIRQQALADNTPVIDSGLIGQDGKVDENISARIDAHETEEVIEMKKEQQKARLKFYRDRKGIK